MNQSELNEILSKHSMWLRGERGGERANLADANLADANLADANLERANLACVNLAGAYLAGAYLVNANLAGAYLAGAYLAGAYLVNANLAGAYLAGADLRGADLAGVRDGDSEIKKCNTVLGLKWNILMFQNIVTVGCQKHSLEQWRNFSAEEIAEMDSKASEFYPLLMQILKYEYKNTPWELYAGSL